ALPTLPRVVPGFDVPQLREKTLRRMTRVDSIKLRETSIRKRKFTPAPKYEPTAEFLAELRPLRPPQYLPTMEPRMRHESEEYRSLSWLKATPPKPEGVSTEMTITDKQVVHVQSPYTPILAAIGFYFFLQSVIFGILLVGCFVALLKTCRALVEGCHMCWSFVVYSLLGCTEDFSKES
ncbi:hypothetical protein H0H87_004808, partial [Tephrocybe sp. NHM501043]